MTAVAAILLAAGRSARMGTPKLTLPFGGRTVFEATVESLLNGGVSRVIAVVGPGSPLCSVAASRLEWSASVTLVENPDPGRGMLSSAQAGAEALQSNEDFMLALGDQPMVPPSVIRAMMAEFERRAPLILRPVFGGKRGHPVLFAATLRYDLLALPPDATIRTLVYAYPAQEFEIGSDVIHRDIDTPDQYHRELECLSSIGNRDDM